MPLPILWLIADLFEKRGLRKRLLCKTAVFIFCLSRCLAQQMSKYLDFRHFK